MSGRVPWLKGPAAIAEWLQEQPKPRTEANGWPLCEHTRAEPGCVPCAYREWANARVLVSDGRRFSSHTIPYEIFHAGYVAGGRHRC